MTRKESIFSIPILDRLDQTSHFFSPFIFCIALALFRKFFLVGKIVEKRKKTEEKYNREKKSRRNDRRIFFRVAGRKIERSNDYLRGKKAKRKRSGKWRAKR